MTTKIAADQKKTSYSGVLERIKGQANILKWKLRGKPLPPPHAVKVDVISNAARKFGCKTLVETGTYLGDMIARSRHLFERLYTIEVDPQLYQKARTRFENDSAISVLLGDSKNELPKILSQLTTPAIFWLDGHYSGGCTGRGDLDTPVQAEVELILRHQVQGHVILVDDARLFTGISDYPSLDTFRDQLLKLKKNYSFSVDTDIIRFEPPSKSI